MGPLPQGSYQPEELKWKRMWRTMLDFGCRRTPARELSAKFPRYCPPEKTLPYTPEILHYLKGKRYELHLITNGFEKTQWSKISNSGVDGFFTHVITSEASNSLKPKKRNIRFRDEQGWCLTAREHHDRR